MKVRVGQQVFDAAEDDEGVLRFRRNQVVRDLVNAAEGGTRLDLNQIAMRHGQGMYTTEDVREVLALIGYSLGGFEELHYNEDVEIERLPDAPALAGDVPR